MEVLPEPAAPWMTSVPGSSSRMMRFCSAWMDATMARIFRSESRPSSRASTSSRTLEALSAAYTSSPRSTPSWRLSESKPSTRPEGAS